MGKRKLSTNIFSYVTCPGKVVFSSSLGTRWGEGVGDGNELANLRAKEQSVAQWLLKQSLDGCAGSWPQHQCGHHVSAPRFWAGQCCLSCTGAWRGWQGQKPSWNQETRVQIDSHCRLVWKHIHIYTPVTSTCWNFPLQISSHQRERKWQKLHGRASPASPGKLSPSPSTTQTLSKQICRLIPAPWANCPWAAMSMLLWVNPIMGGTMAAHTRWFLWTLGPLHQAGHANTTLVHFLLAQEHITSHHTIHINCTAQLSWHETFCHVPKSWEIPAVSTG